ncbi:hypothetical protein HK102_003650 [Quaeritorhiza haematococci]|nr:hypothetical protein HK102_003650 [Quaeritorhiza haematococci]
MTLEDIEELTLTRDDVIANQQRLSTRNVNIKSFGRKARLAAANGKEDGNETHADGNESSEQPRSKDNTSGASVVPASEYFLPGSATVWVKTWGCSHNNSDGEYMAGMLAAHGYGIVLEDARKNEADVWLLNSCTVKGPSEQTFVNEIKKGKDNGKKVIVAGCVPQASPRGKEWAGLSIVGVQQIERVVEVVEETLKGNTVRLLREKKETGSKKKAGGAPLDMPKIRKNRYVEVIPINTGCLNQCTYCKTKHARGDLGSYPPEDILARVETVLQEGVVEIWLTSEDLGAYGHDIGVSITDLLWDIVSTIERCDPSGYAMLRVGMTNPPYILEHLDEMAKILAHPRVYAFLHVPIQAASDAVLDDMRRLYTLADFKRVVDTLRNRVPGVTIATDVICGFPTETPDDFERTLELLREYKFPVLHISQFYPRPGTPAARLQRLPTEEVKRRSRLATQIFESYSTNDSELGQVHKRVLVTDVSGDGKHYIGHSKAYQQVLVPMDPKLMGKAVDVRIVKVGKHYLMAEVLGVSEPMSRLENDEVDGQEQRVPDEAESPKMMDVDSDETAPLAAANRVPRLIRKKRELILLNDDADTADDEKENEDTTSEPSSKKRANPSSTTAAAFELSIGSQWRNELRTRRKSKQGKSCCGGGGGGCGGEGGGCCSDSEGGCCSKKKSGDGKSESESTKHSSETDAPRSEFKTATTKTSTLFDPIAIFNNIIVAFFVLTTLLLAFVLIEWYDAESEGREEFGPVTKMVLPVWHAWSDLRWSVRMGCFVAVAMVGWDVVGRAISQWLSEVKSFLATASPATPAPTAPSTRGNDLARSFATTPASATAPSTAGGPNNYAQAPLLSPVAGIVHHHHYLDEVLEGVTVHSAVQLISVLGSAVEFTRVQAVQFLYKLADIFDKRLSQENQQQTLMDRIILNFQTDDKGYHVCVHELFHYIGASLSNMAVALVAGLECFYTSTDWNVRGICISALTRLVYENEKIFLEEDHHILSIFPTPCVARVDMFTDRIVIIKALGLLSALYCKTKMDLTFRIIESLLTLRDKTALETDAIKTTLRKIFERLAEMSISTPTSTGKADAKTAGDANAPQKKGGSVYGIFLNLLNPHDECAYDLLSWAVETYTICLISATDPSLSSSSEDKDGNGGPARINTATITSNNRTINQTTSTGLIVKNFPPLTDFITSLSNHFRATPALVRYGACVCLHSALVINPTLLHDIRSLYVFVVSGVLDTDHLAAFLYTSMLECVPPTSLVPLPPGLPSVGASGSGAAPPTGRKLSIMPGNNNQNAATVATAGNATSKYNNSMIYDMVAKLRHQDMEPHNYDSIYGGSGGAGDKLLASSSSPLPLTLPPSLSQSFNRSRSIRPRGSFMPPAPGVAPQGNAAGGANNTTKDGSGTKDLTVGDVLDVCVKWSPPLTPKLLHKMANALEYLGKSSKMRQLELIRVWASRNDKFDTFLMQSLVPMLQTPDEEMQMAVIRVIHALMPGFRSATASAADIAFAWEYFCLLLDSKVKPTVLEAVLQLLKAFPLDKLSDDMREEFLNTLFRLTFHPQSFVRSAVYDVIGTSCCEMWRSGGMGSSASAAGTTSGLLTIAEGGPVASGAAGGGAVLSGNKLYYTALAILLLALGDQDSSCVKRVFDHLSKQLRDAPDFLTQLEALRDAMDAKSPELVDVFWQFFLADVPDNHLVRPDEYNYSRNFIHAPFWVALLMTKLKVPPPVVSLSDNVGRDVMPTTPAGKRRFICGYMLCLLPTCGMPDPSMRSAACVAAVRCCVQQNTVNAGMLRGLLEYVSHQMLAHKHWSFQISSLDVLRYILRLKFPGVSQCILVQYIDMVIDAAFNNPASIIKLGALELMETMMLVFPSGINSKLQEIRDTLRSMIVDKDMDIVERASQIYPTVFRCVSVNRVKDFLAYLKSEIAVISKAGLEAIADPLVANLSQGESEHVLQLSLLAMGAMRERSVALEIVQTALPFLKNRNPLLRLAALQCILMQITNLENIDAQKTLWIVLPLYADPNPHIRLEFVRYLKQVPHVFESRLKVLPQHPDDDYVLPTLTWEEILLDSTIINANVKNAADLVYPSIRELDATMTGSNLKILPVEDDGFHLPTISTKLMSRIKFLAKKITGVIPEHWMNETIYFLQDLQKSSHMQGPAILVLSEFCCFHESTLDETTEILVNNLSQEFNSENTTIIEASMVGLRNISEYSPNAFKLILNKIMNLAFTNEGDLMALFYLSDSIKEVCPTRAPDIIRKYISIVSSQRNTIKKRLYAIYLTVELSIIAGPAEMAKVLDAIQAFFDQVTEEEIKVKVYGSLGRILEHLGPKHPMFRSLITTARKEIQNKDPRIRIQSIAIFRIFMKYMAPEEAMWFCFLYLADSNREVRKQAKEMMVLEGLLDFAIGGLKAHRSPNNPRRTAILETCKLPSIQQLGVTINTNATEESIMSSLEDRSTTIKVASPETINKYQWLLNMDTITILHECMKKHPHIATEVVEEVFATIEAALRSRATATTEGDATETAEDMGIEAEIHFIDVLSALLFAYEGVDTTDQGQSQQGPPSPSYVDRLRSFITSCINHAHATRENLYEDLENSFFFFNDYIDVPIVSDEQFQALEAFKAASQEATLEVVKSGKTEKLMSLEDKRNELNDMIDAKSVQLRRLTIMALHGTSGYGLCHALSTTFPEAALISGFQFLVEMLENEHRGIRIAAVEAVITMIKLQLEAAPAQSQQQISLVNKIQLVTETYISRLIQDRATLYRKKADMINMMAQLLPFIKNRRLTIRTLHLLVDFWKDQDSEVRITAVKMIQLLGEAGLPEVIECFDDDTRNSGDNENQPPKIMKELASLIGNPDYNEKDKDHLQQLLKWRFLDKTAS